MTATEFFTTSDGERIAFYIDDFTDPWLPSRPMLLLHSAMGNSDRFYSWVPGLARHFRLIRYDLRGHGKSSVPATDKPFSIDRLVDDARELMTHLGIEAADVTANSAGGYVAQNLALQAPSMVKSLALVGSTPGLSPTALDWLPRIAREGLRPFLADTIAMRFDLASTDPGMIGWFLDQTEGNDAAFVARFITHMASLDWKDQLHRIACPTLVIFPGGETVGAASAYDSMQQNIPDATMIEYPHMPHNIADMLPDRCVADILAFHRAKFGYPTV